MASLGIGDLDKVPEGVDPMYLTPPGVQGEGTTYTGENARVYVRTAREQEAAAELAKANVYGEDNTAAAYNMKTVNYVVYNGSYVSKATAAGMQAKQDALDTGYSNTQQRVFGRGGKAGSLARSQGANIALQQKLAARDMN